MDTVADIIRQKGAHVHSIAPYATAREAIASMETHNVGALLVVDEGRGCGMVTERDFLRKVTLADRDPEKTMVWQIASRLLISVPPETPLEDCMALMTHHRIRHLPAVDRGLLCGLVSMGDVVKHLLSERASSVQHLIEYIYGEFVTYYDHAQMRS
jgi:CBS domain-containing protein